MSATDATPSASEVAKAKKYQRLLVWQHNNPEKVCHNARKSYHTNHAYRNNRRLQHAYKRFLAGVSVGDQLVTDLQAAGFNDVTFKKRWNEKIGVL
jgi:hypothetical protein